MRRADLAERIDSVEHRMDSMEQRLDASFNALSTQILQSRRESHDELLAMRAEMKAQGTALRGEIREGDEETRRFMLILHEDTLSKIALIGEGRRSSA